MSEIKEYQARKFSIKESGLSKYSVYNIVTISYYLLLYYSIYYLQYNSGYNGVLFIFITGIIVSIINRRSGFIYYIFTVFIFDDIPYDLKLVETFVSIDTLYILGQTATKLWSLIWGAIILHDYFKLKYKMPNDPLRKTISVLFLISFTVGIIRGNFLNAGPFINDFRFFINFFIGYYGIILYMKSTEDIYNVFKILGLIFIAKLIVMISQTFLLLNNFTVYTMTGDTGLVLAPTFLLIYYSLLKQNSKTINAIAITLCILSFGIASARGRIFILIFQIILFLFASKKLKRIPLFAFTILFCFSLIPLIDENIYNFLVWKLQSFSPDSDTSESSIVRLVEYKNIISQNAKDFFGAAFGQGLGGSWSSKDYQYPFNLYGKDAYPDEWITNDKFYKPHGIIQFSILKFGFGGFLFLYGLIFIHFFKVKTQINSIKETIQIERYKDLTLSLFTGVCMLFIISYSSKHQFFLGVFLSAFLILKNNIMNQSSLK